MSGFDQKLCAWGGPFCAATLGAGLLMAGFVPPPSPMLGPAGIAVIYTAHASMIRLGMIVSLFGIVGYVAMVALITTQMRHMQVGSRLPADLQLGAGAISVLTLMFPNMVFAIAAFRPERSPELTQMLNDVGWLLVIPAFPTFLAQFGAIAAGTLADRRPDPVFPRWAGYANIWLGMLLIPGAFAFIFRRGPFAWDGLLSFWVAASAFFVWLMMMTPLLLRAIGRTSEAS